MKYIFLLLFPISLFAQKMPLDTIYGKVESVREKMIFLDSVRQSYKLFADEDEWGHHGFMNRRFTLARNYSFWYELPFVHYVNYYRTYDTIGRMATEKWYYKNGEFLTAYQYKYDTLNNKLEEREVDDNGKPYYIERWGYDYQNLLVAKTSFYVDEDTGFYLRGYTYDNDRNLIEESGFSEDEKSSIITHKYFNRNRVQTYYSARHASSEKQYLNWIPLLRFEYNYDIRGNKIQIKDYSTAVFEKEGFPPGILNMEYDSNNNLIKKYYDDIKKDASWTYKYNYNNQLIEELTFYNGKIQRSHQYVYRNGRIIQLIYTEDNKKSIVDFDYKVDKHGNWTEQTKSVNGKKLYIRKRDIKYRK